MGNTCVLKPAPDTPWNATRIGRLIAEQTDIPPGVVNIVTSSRPPRRRGAHHVARSSTWSPSPARPPPAGGSWRRPRATLKPVFLELGGKSVNLVLDDADFAAVGRRARRSVCFHAGQGCAMPTRLLVPALAATTRRSSCVDGGLRRGQLRRPDRPVEPHGPARSRRSSRSGCSATSRRARQEGARARAAAAACPTHLDEGLVRRADALRRRRQLDDDRPGGDLRPGARGDPASTTTTTPCASPTTARTACRG